MKGFDHYKGKYGEYPVMKEARTRRMKSMGLMRQDMQINWGTDHYERWEALSDEERRRLARKMEICAAMIETLDVGIGDVVEEAGEYDSTIILFMSDNGANPKEPHFNSNLTTAEIDKIFDNSWQNMGCVGSFISIGGGWAEACNRLLSYFKLTTAEGGIQVPLIVSGTGAKRRGIVTDQPLHVIYVLPTLPDYTDVERPEARNGHWLDPLYGRSWRRFLDESSQQRSRGHYNRMQGGNDSGLEDPVHGAGYGGTNDTFTILTTIHRSRSMSQATIPARSLKCLRNGKLMLKRSATSMLGGSTF